MILLSDETKIELFGLNSKAASCCGGGFNCSDRLIAIERKMNVAKFRDFLDENLLQSAYDLRLANGLISNKTTTLANS